MFPTAEIAGFDLISQNSPSLIFCFLRSRHWSGRLAFLLFNIDAAISPTCITFASSLPVHRVLSIFPPPTAPTLLQNSLVT